MTKKKTKKGRRRLTLEEQLAGAKKLCKNPKVRKNKPFYNALEKFIAKHER